MIGNRLFSGNSAFGLDAHVCMSSPISRRLVEECMAVTTADLRRVFGRPALQKTAAEAQALKFKLGRQWFGVYLVSEPHRWPLRRPRTLDDSVRLWISCPRCRRRARKLF